MRRENIFDELINNKEVCDMALCAFYDFFQKLIEEFETSAFYRLRKAYEENDRMLSEDNKNTINHDPPF